MNEYKHVIDHIDLVLAKARRTWPDLPAWSRDPITGAPKGKEHEMSHKPAHWNVLTGFDDDIDTYERNAAGRAAAGLDTGGHDTIDNGGELPSFLRKGPLPAPSAPSPAPIEQGIYDLLHEDYGIRPSRLGIDRTSGESTRRANIFRRALDAITRGSPFRNTYQSRPWNDEQQRQIDQLSTAKFSAEVQRSRPSSVRYWEDWKSFSEEHAQGERHMAEQSRGDFFGGDDYRDRSGAIAGTFGAPTPISPILDPEIEEFSTRVRGYVRDNAQLKARIAELEAQLAATINQVDVLQGKLDKIAEHLSCAPMPATSA